LLPYVDDTHHLADWIGQRNRARQYDFMNTSFVLWQFSGMPKVSLQFIKELNLYATHHLCEHPGVFRFHFKYNVKITNTDHVPPPFEEVEAHLAEFLLRLHELYDEPDPLAAATYALWRLNWIHPFAQGNGRTSRALCSFLVAQKFNLWFPGKPLVELIRDNRAEYCALLRAADKTNAAVDMAGLSDMRAFLNRLVTQQVEAVKAERALASAVAKVL